MGGGATERQVVEAKNGRADEEGKLELKHEFIEPRVLSKAEIAGLIALGG